MARSREFIPILEYSEILRLCRGLGCRENISLLQRLNLDSTFTQIYSAESEILGKPHPGIYLTTASKLNVAPQRCLAIEDSLNH